MSLEIITFELKNDAKKRSKIYFEHQRAPTEIPAELPGQFSHSRRMLLHWAAATLKGLDEFQNKVLDNFLPLFLSKKVQFQDSRF